MLTFDKKFFFLALAILIIELLIALFVRDSFVRPYVGDYLVVILICCAIRAVLQSPVLKIAIGVLSFSFLIEILQYFRIVDRLGLQDNIVAKTLIGYGFDWLDLLAYTLGIGTVLALEKINLNHNKNRRA